MSETSGGETHANHNNFLRIFGLGAATIALCTTALAPKPEADDTKYYPVSTASVQPELRYGDPAFSFTEAVKHNERINESAPVTAARLATQITQLKGLERVTDNDDPRKAWVRVGVDTGAGNVTGMVASMAQDIDGNLDPSNPSSIFVVGQNTGENTDYYSLRRDSESDSWSIDTGNGFHMNTGIAFAEPGNLPETIETFHKESARAQEAIELARALQ